jgi:hypothetical protein
MRRHSETFWSSEAGMHREGNHNYWGREHKCTVTNVGFVATNKVILAALV